MRNYDLIVGIVYPTPEHIIPIIYQMIENGELTVESNSGPYNEYLCKTKEDAKALVELVNGD